MLMTEACARRLSAVMFMQLFLCVESLGVYRWAGITGERDTQGPWIPYDGSAPYEGAVS